MYNIKPWKSNVFKFGMCLYCTDVSRNTEVERESTKCQGHSSVRLELKRSATQGHIGDDGEGTQWAVFYTTL